MESSTHNLPPTGGTQGKKVVAPEYGTWPMSETGVANAEAIRRQFDQLQTNLELLIPAGNARYLALVKTKLEEACMFAVKGIAKPTN